MALATFLRLQGRVQQYLWGRAYAESCISRLHPADADPARPFAELWFGAHSTAPAKVLNFGAETLDVLLARHPSELLGEAVLEAFGPELPFLFKVLSIRRPLSIQAHPDEHLARQLHASDPLHYPDPHHKPEVALALSPVELLYGFRAADDVRRHLAELPELAAALPGSALEALGTDERPPEQGAVQRLYAKLLELSATEVEAVCGAVLRRASEGLVASREAAWAVSLATDYPNGDVGILSFFVLKLEQLLPGEAVFIAPNVPHAYLSGELAECMASSDNVVRAGLTNKYKDAATLTRMMTAFGGPLPRLLRKPVAGWQRLISPAREFCLEELSGAHGLECTTEGRVQLLFCLEGKGTLAAGEESELFGPGDAFLVPALTPGYQVRLEEGRLFRVLVP